LHNFVINSLSNQYWTTIGERGVRLSGGQKQRIGIARALYHNPSLLILDEATSALDNITENIVMEAINNISNNITIIIIAHRLSTVKNCDNIFMIENGELKKQGNYQELTKNDLTFQTMKNNL
jgi:ABC-type multidrug transport system fused ATPase/permease subunit